MFYNFTFLFNCGFYLIRSIFRLFTWLTWLMSLARVRALAVRKQRPYTRVGEIPTGQHWWCWGHQSGGRTWLNHPHLVWGGLLVFSNHGCLGWSQILFVKGGRMPCGADARTSAGGVVVRGMMRLVAWCIHGCFGCWCAATRTHARGVFDSACRTRLGGGDRRGWWLMLQSHIVKRRQPGRDTRWSWFVCWCGVCERVDSTSRLVTRSVCESASAVACSASRWSSASVASHGLLCGSLKWYFHLHRQSLKLVSLVPSSAWTVVDWLLMPGLHVRSSRKTMCWSCLATADSIAAAFASQYLPWSRSRARLLSLVSRLTSGLSPRSRAAPRSSIMLRVGSEIQCFFGAWGLPRILKADSCTAHLKVYQAASMFWSPGSRLCRRA